MPLLLPPVCATPHFLAAHALHPRPFAAARPPSASPAVCIDPQDLADDNDAPGTFDQTEDTAHFHVAWDDDNPVLDAELRALYLSSLESAWTLQVDGRGWKAPDQTNNCLITVLLADFADRDSGTGGYTNAASTGDVPYIVLNTDWAEYGEGWTLSLVSHEFNHASQFAYNVFWDEHDWWYWESTAEWVPYLDADLPDIWMWSASYFLSAPWRALHSYEDYTQYGHMVFNRALAEAWGDDTPRAVWAAATDAHHVREAFEAGVPGADFDDAVLDFTSHAAALDVDGPEVWLEALGYFEIDDYWEEVTTLPATGQSAARAPEELGANFLHFVGAEDATLSFEGVAQVDGVDAAWALTLAIPQGDGSFVHEVSYADATGLASVSLPLANEGEVYVGLVPLGKTGEAGADYSWSARADRPDDAADTGDDDEKRACGCNGVGAPAGLAWLLAAGIGLRRRRRMVSADRAGDC